MEVDIHAGAADNRRLSVCLLSSEDIYSGVIVRMIGKHDSSIFEIWYCVSPFCNEHQ